MRIENKENYNNIKMSDIKVGECFIYNDSLHMKVDIGSLDYSRIDRFPNIVINLESNRLNSIIDSVLVQKVAAKIVIE